MKKLGHGIYFAWKNIDGYEVGDSRSAGALHTNRPFTSNSEMLCDFETGVSNEIRSFRYLRQLFVPVDKTKAGIVGLNYKIKNLCCPRRASVEASYYGAKRMVRRATTHFRDQVPLKVTSRAIILSLLWLRP